MGFLGGLFKGGFVLLAYLVAAVFSRLFDGEYKLFGVVFGFDLFFSGLIFLSVLLGLFYGVVYFLFGKVAACRNGDGLALVGTLVDGFYAYDAVSVDIEGNLDLRNSARRSRPAKRVRPPTTDYPPPSRISATCW